MNNNIKNSLIYNNYKKIIKDAPVRAQKLINFEAEKPVFNHNSANLYFFLNIKPYYCVLKREKSFVNFFMFKVKIG